MFKRMLVPLDGSHLAERALPVAALIARASSGSIVVLGVVPTRLVEGRSPTPAAYAVEVVENDLRGASAYLQETAHSSAASGVTIETHAVFDAVAPAILAATQTYGADLVVMSSHGMTGMARWLIGSVAQKVARHSPVPVLVLRADGPLLTGEHAPRALVSLDGSPLAEAALDPALQLMTAVSGTAQSEVHLLRVLAVPTVRETFRSQAPGDLTGSLLAQEQQEAQAYLEAVTDRVRRSTPGTARITSSLVVAPDVAAAIIDQAEHSEATGGTPYDVIAMATHGRGGIQRWVLGSVTERVLGATRLPLLIVRPPEVREAYQSMVVGV